MENRKLPQYMRIAAMIAAEIARGDIPEGKRLPGLSVLSSSFGVSPETIRKALSLLADMHIVEIRESRGSYVLSADQAHDYLQTIQIRQNQMSLSNRLEELYRQYTELGREMVEISSQLVAASASPLPGDQALPNYEVRVPADSDKVGMTIGELRFWQCTGATIVAIKRGQDVMISPGPYTNLHVDDIIVYVGSPACKEAVELLLSPGKNKSLYSVQEQIFEAIHARELYIIAEALDAKLGDLSDFTPMTRGMTNRSFLFTCKGEKYILRIPGEGTENLINRRQEAEVYEAIRGTGLCDDVVYMNPENGLKVTRFLNNVRNCDPYQKEDVEAAIRLMRSFHEMDLKVGHEFRILDHINYYEQLYAGPSEHPDYDHTKKKVMQLHDFVMSQRSHLCLTHIDAVPDNFLFYSHKGEEGLQLTDWEYAGMQDPHVDIAMFCIYSEYDRPRIDRVIDLYFRGSCPPETRVKIYCYIAACGLLWSNWCEYKRTLGVEFGDYARAQYDYARTYSDIARHEIEALKNR